VGVGLGAVRHLGVAGRAAVHRLHPVPGGDLDRQVLGSHSAAHLLTPTPLQATRLGHDPRRLAGSSCHHLSAHFWLVLVFIFSHSLLSICMSLPKVGPTYLSEITHLVTHSKLPGAQLARARTLTRNCFNTN